MAGRVPAGMAMVSVIKNSLARPVTSELLTKNSRKLLGSRERSYAERTQTVSWPGSWKTSSSPPPTLKWEKFNEVLREDKNTSSETWASRRPARRTARCPGAVRPDPGQRHEEEGQAACRTKDHDLLLRTESPGRVKRTVCSGSAGAGFGMILLKKPEWVKASVSGMEWHRRWKSPLPNRRKPRPVRH